jgi:hypothetical protein
LGAALIIGSAFVIAAGEDAATWRIPLVGITLQVAQISFIVAAVLAAWLPFSIIHYKGF